MRQDSSKLDLTERGNCASFNFRRTARAVTKLYDAALQESGIRSTQFAILVGIAKKPTGLHQRAGGQCLPIDQTTLTRSCGFSRKKDSSRSPSAPPCANDS